jgi:hypothetical protein
MTPYAFGEKIARSLQKQAIGGYVPDFSQTSGTGSVAAPKPAPIGSKPQGSLLSDMSNNSARVGGGILSTVAGGVGTGLTGLAAGANSLWNAVTPKSMNTSNQWTAGVNNAFNKSVELTQAGAQDVYGGLGGDTDYERQKSWDVMERGFNDPNVDPISQNIAWGAGWAGHGAWNAASMRANPGKMLGAAGQAGKLMPTLARAGKVVNKIDDFGATPIEMVNFGNQTLSGISESMNQPQQPAQPQQSQSPYWNDYAAFSSGNRIQQSLDPSQPSPYSL